jgi:hypothetical protein
LAVYSHSPLFTTRTSSPTPNPIFTSRRHLQLSTRLWRRRAPCSQP